VREVVFALPPSVVLLDVAGPAEAFRIANQFVPDSYALRYASPSPQLRSGVGLELAGLEPLPAALAEGSIALVPGVVSADFDMDSEPARALSEWLARAVDERVTLMCVCAGALFAAHAGLLVGRECTTHHVHLDELRRAEPSAQVHDNRIFVEDGPVVTSAGITAGIDLALHLIGRDLGMATVGEVARAMVVYLRRAGSDPALSPWLLHRNHLHAAVHRVQDAVVAEPCAEWSSRALAEVACTSSRHLARLFAEHAGCTPLEYVQRLRLALARDLITQSDLDMERVAERAGFSSAHQLRRVWRRWEAQPPALLRHLARVH
jgi:transcriptional regulator GlxA family with amidase domain